MLVVCTCITIRVHTYNSPHSRCNTVRVPHLYYKGLHPPRGSAYLCARLVSDPVHGTLRREIMNLCKHDVLYECYGGKESEYCHHY